MKINILKINLFLAVLLLLTACSESFIDFGEQYKKTLYIVNSRDMLYTGEHFYGTEENMMLFPVYCASSEPIKKDITVTLMIDEQALDSLNKKNALGNPLYVNKVILPSTNYKIENLTITIKANEQYGVLRVPLNPKGLNPDIAYTLPISIVSNSEGFDVNTELKTLVYEVKMTNGFSGSFYGSSIELPKTIRSVVPVLKALSPYSVRMPVHTLPDEVTNLDTNFMVLTIAPDSTTVTITPWANAQVKDRGNSTYDKKRQAFVLKYTFTNADGTEMDIEEKITNMDAPVIDEDDK